MTNSFVKLSVSPEKLTELVNTISEALAGEQDAHVMIACIVTAILAQEPDMDEDVLRDMVMRVSEYLCMLLGEGEPALGLADDERKRMN